MDKNGQKEVAATSVDELVLNDLVKSQKAAVFEFCKASLAPAITYKQEHVSVLLSLSVLWSAQFDAAQATAHPVTCCSCGKTGHKSWDCPSSFQGSGWSQSPQGRGRGRGGCAPVSSYTAAFGPYVGQTMGQVSGRSGRDSRNAVNAMNEHDAAKHEYLAAWNEINENDDSRNAINAMNEHDAAKHEYLALL